MSFRLANKDVFVGLLFVFVLFVPAANALPVGAMGIWSGSVDFYGEHSIGILTGHVDYAVYEADDYPGTAPPGGDYVYAYQVFNTGDPQSGSDKGAAHLTVYFLEEADVGTISWDDYAVSNGVEPYDEYFWSPTPESPLETAVFWFLYDLVDPGEKSVNLLFSGGAPTWGSGRVGSGPIIAEIESGSLPTPTPIPEPSTVALLTAGACLLKFARAGRRRV